MRRFKGDRFTRAYGSPIPVGATIQVRRFFPRRRAIIEYGGRTYLTMLWCLEKMARQVTFSGAGAGEARRPPLRVGWLTGPGAINKATNVRQSELVGREAAAGSPVAVRSKGDPYGVPRRPYGPSLWTAGRGMAAHALTGDCRATSGHLQRGVRSALAPGQPDHQWETPLPQPYPIIANTHLECHTAKH